MKDKKVIYLFVIIALLIISVVGVTYAFFNYTRTGAANNFSTGRIYFNSTQDGRLQLTNIFPVKASEVDASTLDSVSVNVLGDTTYTDGEEFKVTLTDVTNTVNGKKIPINYIATYTANTDAVIGTSSSDYWNARNNKDASIYTLSSTGSVEEGKQVLVGYIDNGETGINGTLTIKAYIDAERIAITDTPDENSEWQQGRTVLTTEEWNSFQISSTPISFKIKAESNEGIWVEREATPASCFTTEHVPSYIRNPNMNVSTCVSKLTEFWGAEEEGVTVDTGETYEAYCNGTGTRYGATFQEQLNNGVFDTTMLSELEESGIITSGYTVSIFNYDASCGSDVVIPRSVDFKTYTRNPNMNVSTCVSKLTEFWGAEEEGVNVDTGETYQAFCNGTGTLWGDVFQKWLNNGFSTSELSELESAEIIIANGTESANVVAIGYSAFYNKGLTSVTIPDSVIYIGEGAFKNNQLINVIIPNDVINNICDGEVFDTSVVIQYKNGSQLICPTKASCFATTISNGNVSITDYDTTCGKNVIIPSTINGYPVTIIGNSAFSYNQLTSVEIPNSVTSIGASAFSNNQLTSVTIPNSVTTIGSSAFSNNQLTNVTIPNSVTTIESSAFSDNQLTNVTIPNSVTIIGNSAFSYNQLTSVEIPNSVTSIGASAFKNNQLTSVTIPNSVTTIGRGAFTENHLSQIVTPDNFFELNSSHMCDISSIIQTSTNPARKSNISYLDNLYCENKVSVRIIAVEYTDNIVDEGVQIINSSGTKQCSALKNWNE